MPYGNRMGPDGMGPGTGRGMGFCAGFDRPGCYNYAGRGMGRGRNSVTGTAPGFSRGAGRGRAGFYNSPERAAGFYQEKGFSGNMGENEILKEMEENLENELAAVKSRIKTLDALSGEDVKSKE